MKRIYAAVVIALGISMAASAQQIEQQTSAQQVELTTTRVITGAVIDKNGNPLPGAIVSATGGAETVTADADGSFTIEVPLWLKSLTASYPGLGEKKMKTKVSQPMVFTLQKNRTQGFVNLIGACAFQLGAPDGGPSPVGQLGIMAGVYRSWGAYAKITFGIAGGGRDYYGEKLDHSPSVTVGVIKRISPTVNLFLGLGACYNYGVEDDYWEFGWDPEDDVYIKGHYLMEYNFALETGVMVKFSNKLNGIFGMNYVGVDCANNEGNLVPFLGIGINL